MKELPILFSTMMVQANLDDRKGMTRRMFKPQPIIDESSGRVFDGAKPVRRSPFDIHNWKEIYTEQFCHYKVGDILWVRETHYAWGWWIQEGATKAGKLGWRFKDFTPEDQDGQYYYETKPPENIVEKRVAKRMGWYRRPAIFMPKEAARIWLQVTDVSIERLQEISGEDVLAEGIGVEFRSGAISMTSASIDYKMWSERQEQLFADMWVKINGAVSWEANPWVWVVKYKVLSKAGRPAAFPTYNVEAV